MATEHNLFAIGLTVCSSAEAEALVKRKWTLEHANNAHTWNFDRESCKPALAFSSAP